MNREQLEKIREGNGFIAALDQSGGSTPKALRAYGVGDDAWSSDTEMFDRIHEMRTRIVTSPGFDGERVVGAILFENTMDRDVGGKGTADYLWTEKRVVPFLKIDKGMEAEGDGVQMMKPMPKLAVVLERARAKGVFGTKMRSLVNHADPRGIAAVVEQQFEVGRRIADTGLVPILEPEVGIHSPDKAAAEELLRDAILERLATWHGDVPVMLKLTLPSTDGFYQPLVDHPKVLKVVALSGGYEREEANALLARNPGVIASFSRALLEGLSADQSDDAFDRTLDGSIQSIYEASVT